MKKYLTISSNVRRMIMRCDRDKEGEVVFGFITAYHVSNGGSLRPSATPLVLYLPTLHKTAN